MTVSVLSLRRLFIGEMAIHFSTMNFFPDSEMAILRSQHKANKERDISFIALQLANTQAVAESIPNGLDVVHNVRRRATERHAMSSAHHRETDESWRIHSRAVQAIRRAA